MLIVVNYKNYKSGRGALELSKTIQKYLRNAIVCVSAIDIQEISEKTKLKVFAQHVDYSSIGESTGFVVPEFVKHIGASGSLINHSEHRVGFDVIKKTIKHASRVKLKLAVCANSVSEARRIMQLRPYAIAFEDPKLVGSGRSITKYKSADILKFVKLLKGSGIIPLCGAGVSTAEDVLAAKSLGCKGVLISSAIAKVKNPEKLLRQLRGLV